MKKKTKQILAIIGVILLLSLYVISFISALMSSKHSLTFFLASLIMTITIPILIYGYMLIHKFFNRNNDSYYIDESFDQARKYDNKEDKTKSK